MLTMLNVSTRKQPLLLLRSVQRYRSTCCLNTLAVREYTVPAGTPGSGVGKGGGAGGTVRQSGGGLGKYGAAQEEGYFHHKEKEALQKLKNQLKRGEDINVKPPK